MTTNRILSNESNSSLHLKIFIEALLICRAKTAIENWAPRSLKWTLYFDWYLLRSLSPTQEFRNEFSSNLSNFSKLIESFEHWSEYRVRRKLKGNERQSSVNGKRTNHLLKNTRVRENNRNKNRKCKPLFMRLQQ